MSVASNNNRKGLSVTVSEFKASDNSIHPYFDFAGIWIFVGAGAPTESTKAIAGDGIPTGSFHINTTTGVQSTYNGSAWKAITQAS